MWWVSPVQSFRVAGGEAAEPAPSNVGEREKKLTLKTKCLTFPPPLRVQSAFLRIFARVVASREVPTRGMQVKWIVSLLTSGLFSGLRVVGRCPSYWQLLCDGWLRFVGAAGAALWLSVRRAACLAFYLSGGVVCAACRPTC